MADIINELMGPTGLAQIEPAEEPASLTRGGPSGEGTLAQAAGMSPDLLLGLLRATAARCVRI